jgi:hypothetical protein
MHFALCISCQRFGFALCISNLLHAFCSERRLLVASAWSQRPYLATLGSNSGDRGISVHSAREREEKAFWFKKNCFMHLHLNSKILNLVLLEVSSLNFASVLHNFGFSSLGRFGTFVIFRFI